MPLLVDVLLQQRQPRIGYPLPETGHAYCRCSAETEVRVCNRRRSSKTHPWASQLARFTKRPRERCACDAGEEATASVRVSVGECFSIHVERAGVSECGSETRRQLPASTHRFLHSTTVHASAQINAHTKNCNPTVTNRAFASRTSRMH
jgi:hypothetical protein